MNIPHFLNALRLLGLLLMPFSLSMIPPMIVAVLYHENTVSIFLLSALLTFGIGFCLWIIFRKSIREIYARDGFLIVTLLWFVLSLTGAFPFLLSETPKMTFIDGFFETVSGLTTTGASVIADLNLYPRSLIYYRQQLQFIGGGGIILLGIAILPMLSVGGMQLIRAEASVPFKEEKLTPRITETAKTLWYIYVGLVVLCALSYWIGGMTFFDALTHSFGTISTGGFSTHNEGFAFFDSRILECLAIFFMFAGAVSFSLHFLVLRRWSFNQYWHDPEFKAYLRFWVLISSITVFTLFYYHVFKNPLDTVIKSLFHVTSTITTTGYTSVNISLLPTFIPFLLMFVSLLGGTSGSTSGGFKMVRMIILRKHAVREILRLIHPKGHYVVKLGANLLHYRTLDAVFGFLYIFVIIFIILLLSLLATGLDFLTAFSGLVTAISNSGVSLGKITDTFQGINHNAKLIISFAMLTGRLELFSVLVLFAPSYWRN